MVESMELIQLDSKPSAPTPSPAPSGDVPLRPTPVQLTEKAAEMVHDAMAQEGLSNHGLRVGVIGGGCSGLQYLLDFSDKAYDLDDVSEQHGVPVYIDPFSAAHLHGTVINYVDGLHGAGFKFENPNIVRACGCGSSFTT
jgi:iron-sulfur cluster insertion protein